MVHEKKFLVDVGMRDLPFPMKVISKVSPEGQSTVGNISITARIMQEFEALWIDKFIRILHQHRSCIGTSTLQANILDYIKELKATTVTINFDYPFFIEKLTPVDKEKCLVRYNCVYSAKVSSLNETPKILFRINVPALTTYPVSDPSKPRGLFAQLSVVGIEIEANKDVYPEDLVAIVDSHALSPVYSFLTEKDQAYIIEQLHTKDITSVVLTDAIKNELAHRKNIDWYSIQCSNYGMLHSYITLVGTEKSMWVPFSGYES
ncbi:MAG: GTP cyclohydrolase, FolE2/MptA family [bacterium]